MGNPVFECKKENEKKVLNSWNTENRIQNTEYRIQNTEYRIQYTEYRTQDTEYRIQIKYYRIQKFSIFNFFYFVIINLIIYPV